MTSAQHAILVFEVEGPFSAELSRMDRLAEVIKFLLLHDFLLIQRLRQELIRMGGAARLALPHKPL